MSNVQLYDPFELRNVDFKFEFLRGDLCASCVQGLTELLRGNTWTQKKTFTSVQAAASLNCWFCNYVVSNSTSTSSKLGRRKRAISITTHSTTPSERGIRISAEDSNEEESLSKFRLVRIDNLRPVNHEDIFTRQKRDLTWSAEACKTVFRWLHECDNEHLQCQSSSNDSTAVFRPSRLIDLTSSASGILRLVKSQDILNDDPYIALSHCWGKSRKGILTTSNIANLSEGFLVRSLPQCIQDAIKISSDLNIHYLWVDSQCIIQDSRGDWAREAPQMADVYSNAYLTIAGAASSDDAQSIIFEQDDYLVFPLEFSVDSANDKHQNFRFESIEGFDIFVNRSVWNHRAWVLQERALSRRILFLGIDQIYWQCPSCVDAQYDLRYEFENSPVYRPSWLDLMQWSGTNIESGTITGRRETWDQDHEVPELRYLLEKWDLLVEEYTARKLTHLSDKLTAISGLAKRFCALLKCDSDNYLAGIWRQSLPSGLLWKVASDDEFGPSNPFPSWSWASTNSPVLDYRRESYYNGEGDIYQGAVKVLETSILNGGNPLAPSSTVTAGSIVVQGKLCQLKLIYATNTAIDGNMGFRTVMIRSGRKWTTVHDLKEDLTMLFEPSFDRRWSWPGSLRRTVFFMPIVSKVHTRDKDWNVVTQYSFVGLMLQPTKKSRGQFRRVGLLHTGHAMFDQMSSALDQANLDKDQYQAYNPAGGYTIEIV